MKKIYEAPKAEKNTFEAKDIITMSNLGVANFGNTGDAEVSGVVSVSWNDLTGST